MASPQFPGALVTDTQLPNVGDGMGQKTLLNGAINDAVTTITVDDTTNFASTGYFIVGTEVVTYTGKTATTFTGCTRGALGTVAASHSDNDRVACAPLGRVWDQMGEEIKAIEAELGVDPAGAQATVVARLDAADSYVNATGESKYKFLGADGDNTSSWKIPSGFSSTGVCSGGVLSTGAGAAQFSISDGMGVIVDDTTDPPSVTVVNWTGKSNINATHIATNLISYISIDSGANVIQRQTRWTPDVQRTEILLGVIVHVDNATVNTVNIEAQTCSNPQAAITDLFRGIGFINTEGNVYSANGANMNINKSAGKVLGHGSNWGNDPLNPNVLTLAALTAAPFQYRLQNGTNHTGLAQTTILPNILDDGDGTPAAVSVNKWTVQRIYSFLSNAVKIQPGQKEYNSLEAAQADLSDPTFVTEPSIADNGLFRAYLIVKQGATDLSDAAQAKFLAVGKFGSVGGGAGAGGNALTTDPLSQFAATTSAQLAGVISDETGSGSLVFATSPTLVTPALGTPASGALTNCTSIPAGQLTGTVVHERGGLEADVSAYSGLIKISGGATSQAVADTDYAAATHASRHQSGGADAIKLDDLASPDDNTDLNATTSAHGLLPKLNNNASTFLDGTGAWSAVSGAPTGAVVMYGAAAAPTGWLLCDGTAVSRTTYSDLFAVISTTYGVGDGSTTFNLPDVRQRFPLGKAASGTGATLGETGGSIDHTHSYSGVISHTHTFTTASNGSHTHTVNSHSHSVDPPSTGSDSQGSHTHTNSADDGSPVGGYARHFATGGAEFGTVTTGSAGAHTHSTNIGSFSSGGSSPATDSQGSHTHTGTTDSTGSASQTTASSNPSYVTFNYIIKT